MRGDGIELHDDTEVVEDLIPEFGWKLFSRDQGVAALMPRFILSRGNFFSVGSALSTKTLRIDLLANMPSTIDSLERAAKRKRKSSEDKPSKRARSESSDDDVQAQVLLLETEIFESKQNYNNIATLIKLLRDDDEDAENSVVAAIALCRVFTRLMVSEEMTKREGIAEKEAVVVKWLKERYSEYKTAILLLLGEENISSTALTLCMRLLKTEGQHLHDRKEYNFPTKFLMDIVRVLLKSGADGSTRREFSAKYVEENDDVRFYTLEAVELVFGSYVYCSSLTLAGKF